MARAWGFDKILGNKYLDHISNAGNVPGTDAIGGAANLEFPKFKEPKGPSPLLAGLGAALGFAQSAGIGAGGESPTQASSGLGQADSGFFGGG